MHRVTTCVGRLSAQIEHHWLMSDQPTAQVETQRDHLEDILETLISPDVATRILSERIEAKMAHASLLTQAAFSQDPRHASWAEKRAEQELAFCRSILLQPAPETAAKPDSAPVSDMDTVNQGTWQASQ
ncbi:MAG: hypothetical protein ACEPO2_10045 [Pelagibaca sp.]